MRLEITDLKNKGVCLVAYSGVFNQTRKQKFGEISLIDYS